MALDFPSNPTDGQVFGSYVWSASKGVWQSREESAAPAVISSLPPTIASNGDIWFDSSDGTAYVYYDDGNTSQWVEMMSSGVPSLEQTMPVASIIQTARVSAPTGWLLCEGQAVSRTQYKRLFDAIGTLYGSGDGTTTFNVPNLANRVPVGKGTGTFSTLGSVGGSETHSLTEPEMPRHTHIQNSHNHTQDSHNHTQNAHSHLSVINLSLVNTRTAGSNCFNSDGAADKSGGIASTTATNNPTTATNQPTTAVNQFTGGTGTSQSSSNGQAHNNLQPYIVMNYMIKV